MDTKAMVGETAGLRVVMLLRRLSRDGTLVCLLGWAAMRVWAQGTLYDAYRSSDAGLVSMAGSLAYSVVYLLIALISLRRPPGPRLMGWVGFAFMAAAPIASIASDALGTTGSFVAHTLLAGLGTAAGTIMWVLPYSRLARDEALFWVFASMAVTALGGYALSFVPHPQSDLLCVLLAPVVLLTYQRALAATSDAEKPGLDLMADVSGADPARAGGWGRLPRLLLGIAAFGLMLGISRGYPSGRPIALGIPLRTVYQLGVAALSAAIVWRAFVCGRSIRRDALWRVELAVAVFAVLVLLLAPGAAGPYAVALMNVANSLLIGIVMLDVIDVARATSLHPYVVQSVAGCVRGLSRDAGRLLVVAIAASAQPLMVGLVAIVLALAVSAALLLSGGSGDDGPATAQETADGSARRAEGDAEPSAPIASAGQTGERLAGGAFAPAPAPVSSPSGPSSATGDGSVSASASSPLRPVVAGDAAEAALRQRAVEAGAAYGLTERETQVALLIARGHSKTRIADFLGRKESTVRTHAKNVYAKLGVQSREELMELLG